MEIREAVAADAEAVAAIYGDAALTTWATFDVAPLPVAAWTETIASDRPGHHLLVGVEDGEVVGYAKSGTFRPRPAYDPTVETSIYVARPGQGRGTQLYQRLFALLDAGPCHLAVVNIALPNDASVRLHARFGFAEAGTLFEVGRKFDRWHDVLSMQRPLGSAA